METLKKARAQFVRILLPLGLFSLVVNVLLLTMPLYMLQIYDRVLPSRSLDTLTFLSIIAAAALVVLGLMEMVRALVASRAAAKMEATLGAETLMVSMNSGRATQGDVQPLRDLMSLKTFIGSRAIFGLLDLPFAPLFIAILYLVHPNLFWMTVGGAVVLLLLAVFNQWLVSKKMMDSGNRSMAALTAAQALARNSDSLRAMGMVDNGINIWGGNNAEAMQAQNSVDARNAVLTGISRTVRMGLQVAILGYGGYLVLQGQMTAGMIFASSIIAGRGLQPIDQVIGGWRQYAASWAAWKRLRDVLARQTTDKPYTPMPDAKGAVAVENVSVVVQAGRPDQPILDRVSFVLEPGKALGIVGPSGSGKSTLARVLVGAIFPSAGAVRIDGSDLKNWEPSALGRQVGYLSQEVELLPGSVAQNIARLEENPDPNALQEAAGKAQILDLIKSLPNGFDTLVGHGGLGLSGGQRQRIALARAFYGNPQIMVLDEPNANLDEEGEKALHNALALARQNGVTVILITQRRQALASVDYVLRLHAGKIDFFGTKEELVAKLSKLAGKPGSNVHPMPNAARPQPRPGGVPAKIIEQGEEKSSAAAESKKAASVQRRQAGPPVPGFNMTGELPGSPFAKTPKAKD